MVCFTGNYIGNLFSYSSEEISNIYLRNKKNTTKYNSYLASLIPFFSWIESFIYVAYILF